MVERVAKTVEELFDVELANQLGAVLAARQTSLAVGCTTMLRMIAIQVISCGDPPKENRETLLQFAGYLKYVADGEVEPARKLDS